MNHPDIKLGIYKHYKGLLVQVLAVARHTETEERMVIYIPLNGNLQERKGPMVSARPIDMFLEKAEKEGQTVDRFEYIGHTLS
jgi:hypothetical protein